MQFKDYYRILGVATEASADEIKTAYRKLARKLHPDVNKAKDAAQRFAELTEANEALKDPERRATYDQVRAGGWRDGQEMDVPHPARRGPRAYGADPDDDSDVSDFFESVFGRGSSTRGRSRGTRRGAFHQRGDDIHATLAVTLEQAYRGGERQFSLRAPTRDDDGELVAGERTITVKIPAGVTHGSKVRLRGQGQPGTSAELNGDLYLEFELSPHRLYRVEGRDLSLDLPIAPWEAVLGAQIAVPTLGGTVTATIPPGAQSGQKLRLKGRGLPGDPAGDQYLVLMIAVPTVINDQAKALYVELAKESAFNPREKLGV